MAQFKKGDVVQLRSGGPLMTVHHAQTDGDLFCVWFYGDDPEPKSHVFNPESLKSVDK